MKVGFMLPNNQTVFMDYDEVNDFCRIVCENIDNYDDFIKFSKDYSYFDPYFDYVMTKLKYVFINPFMKDNNYLKAVKNKLFIIESDDGNLTYEEVSNYAIDKNNAGYYCDLVISSNSELNIESPTGKLLKSWLIDPNGIAMITKSDEEFGNHEITANTILNNLLIKDNDLWQKVDFNKYSVINLVERFGFLRTVKYDDISMIIGVKRHLSIESLDLVEKYINSGIIYRDWEEKFPDSVKELLTYIISKKEIGERRK